MMIIIIIIVSLDSSVGIAIGCSSPQRKERVPSGVCENILMEPLEPWASSDPRTHEDSSPNWGTGMPETSSVISLTGQNHISNLQNI
jgi:hypothetical protein